MLDNLRVGKGRSIKGWPVKGCRRLCKNVLIHPTTMEIGWFMKDNEQGKSFPNESENAAVSNLCLLLNIQNFSCIFQSVSKFCLNIYWCILNVLFHDKETNKQTNLSVESNKLILSKSKFWVRKEGIRFYEMYVK